MRFLNSETTLPEWLAGNINELTPQTAAMKQWRVSFVHSPRKGTPDRKLTSGLLPKQLNGHMYMQP